MMKSQRLLVPFPTTRINDVFVDEGSEIDFSLSQLHQNSRDPIIQGGPCELGTRFFADFYKKIGVDIVCETTVNYPYPFMTEKTYRAIVCLRPFIIVGPYRILEFIKSFNFQTFPAIIDESYDQIQDHEQRFFSVCNSIRQFVSRPIEQVKKDIASVEPVLLHNQTVLQGLIDAELARFKSQI